MNPFTREPSASDTCRTHCALRAGVLADGTANRDAEERGLGVIGHWPVARAGAGASAYVRSGRRSA
jgi:hypothetical protein